MVRDVCIKWKTKFSTISFYSPSRVSVFFAPFLDNPLHNHQGTQAEAMLSQSNILREQHHARRFPENFPLVAIIFGSTESVQVPLGKSFLSFCDTAFYILHESLNFPLHKKLNLIMESYLRKILAHMFTQNSQVNSMSIL